jgi:peroxiredoxin
MSARILANLALLLTLLGGVWLVWPTSRPMPEVTFNLLDGRTLSGADLRGKSVLLNFWSVNCAVCLRDMPRLKQLHESLTGQNFMVIGVAIPQDPPPAVIDTVERLDPGYPIALDVHGEVSKAFGGIKVTPTSYLITPGGDISFAAHGPLDETRVRATVLTYRG